MFRSFSAGVTALTMLLAPVLMVPLAGDAQAQPQPKPIPAIGPAAQRITKLYQARINRIVKSCEIDRRYALVSEMRATETTLDQQAKLQQQNQTTPDRKRRFQDTQAALAQLRSYLNEVQKSCDPHTLAVDAVMAANDCSHKLADTRLAKLRRLVGMYRLRSEAAKALGSKSKVDPALAKSQYDRALQLLEGATENAKRRHRCDRQFGTGDVDGGGETVDIPEIGGPPEEAAPTSEMLEQWSWIAGTWTIANIGGQIEFRVEADGTLSGYIVQTNQRMIAHGYAKGMQIMRGYRMAGVNGITWNAWTQRGEVFSARIPGRDPGAIWGSAEWTVGGILILPKNASTVSLPPLLKNRLANFGNVLVRP